MTLRSLRPFFRRTLPPLCLMLALLLAGAAPTPTGLAQIDASSFAPKADFATGSNPYGVALGDFDGDGKPDMAVTTAGATSALVVFRNTSTPGAIDATSFAPPVSFPTGTNPSGVAIADVDGDGMPDAVVANTSSSTISVFRNTSTPGNVSFAPRVDFATGLGPFVVVTGDVDGDGKLDVAVDNYDADSVSVFRNTSTAGSVSFAPRVDLTTGSKPYSVAIGDVNGDGRPDLAAPNRFDDTVSVFRNTSVPGVVAFDPRVDFATGPSPAGSAIDDLDGDGRPDLTVTNETADSVSVLRNTSLLGSVSFAPKADFTTGANPYTVAAADVDGDGQPDLAVTNRFGNTVSLFENTSTPGSISFAPRVDFATGT